MIRIAEPKDYIELANIRWEHKAEDDIVYGENNVADAEKEGFIQDFVNFLYHDSTYQIYILEMDNRIISQIYVQLIRKVPKPNKKESYIAYLTNAHTINGYRSKGYGTQLLEEIIRDLKKTSCEMAFLWPSEKSVNWYHRNNFKNDNEMVVIEI